MPVASRARQALEAVLVKLAGITVGAGYHCTLSDPGQIFVGEGIPASAGPLVVAIGDPRIASEHGPQLGRYKRTLTVPFIGRVPATGGTGAERIYAALDVASDIKAALEADRTLGGLVLDLIVEADTFVGAEVGWTGCGGVSGTISVYWHANSGAGS